MKITIISIGKFDNSPHRIGFDNYLKRMKWQVELKEIDLKNTKNLSSEKLKEAEFKAIISALKPNSVAIALDENGKEFGSEEFAELISNFSLHGKSALSFIIGGTDGLHSEIFQQAKVKMSLSKMTFPHLMVRVMLIEQLYRAQSIIAKHPYHRK